jgi:hypothetical protein
VYFDNDQTRPHHISKDGVSPALAARGAAATAKLARICALVAASGRVRTIATHLFGNYCLQVRLQHVNKIIQIL